MKEPHKIQPSLDIKGQIKSVKGHSIYSLIEQNKRVILYVLIGASAALLDFLIFAWLHTVVGLKGFISTIISICISTVYGFTMNTFFNFRTFDRIFSRFLSYFIVSIFALTTSAVFLFVFSDLMKLNGVLVKAVTLPFIVIAQYFLNRKYAFSETRERVYIEKKVIPKIQDNSYLSKKTNIDCTIIPPTFNESQNVVELVRQIKQSFKNSPWLYEILFVDDSNDDTPQVLRQMAKNDSSIRVIHRKPQERSGLATAFVEGFNHAKGEIICCMDADLQHPPKLIPKLIDTIKLNPRVSMAVASRYAPGGSEEGLSNLFRKIVSNTSKFVTHLLFPRTKKTGDPMTGFFAFDRKILQGVNLQPKGFKILVEMLVRIKGIRVLDIPMIMKKRIAGTTKASLKQGMAFLRHLWDLKRSVQG